MVGIGRQVVFRRPGPSSRRGAVTAALLDRIPVAPGATAHCATYTAIAPDGSARVPSARLPVPEGAQIAPAPTGVQVQLQVRLAGKTSATVALATGLGPALTTGIE